MEKLFYALIKAWCWLRIAASPLLIGAVLGAAACYLIGGPLGLVTGALLVLLGLYLGLRLADHARRKGQLVDFAHALPPRTDRPDEGSQ